MTYYIGSKADHADEILKIVLAKRKPNQTFVEPFLGGANIMCRVPQKQGPRIGGDINPYMIALHTALAAGWEPPSQVSEPEYNKIKKNNKGYPPELVGYVGTTCAFGSHWFDSYRGGRTDGATKTYIEQGRAYALKDAPGLRGATFIHSSYDQLPIPPNSLIYCDPPYVGTTGYMDEHQEQWRAYKFWRWADKMVDEGHMVFVSEYKEPQPGDIYPSPPMTEAHKATLKEASELQQQMVALGDKPTPPAMAARREELWSTIKDHEAKRAEEPKRLAARWKVVWSKEVKVNFAAVNVDAGKGEEAKTETEKLFHREA
jgi:DNA adenine methylase